MKRKRERWGWLLFLGLWWLVAWIPPAQKPPVVFDQPQDNQAVQGRVAVRLAGRLEVVRDITLDFAYADAPDAWFPLARRRGLPADGLLASWDTTTLTDGDYLLRVAYTTQDGEHFVVQIRVRVRNYTPVETPTPTPAPPEGAGGAKRHPSPTPTPTVTPVPPTPLPPNPAALDATALPRIWLQGALGAALALLGVAWYGFIRRQR